MCERTNRFFKKKIAINLLYLMTFTKNEVCIYLHCYLCFSCHISLWLCFWQEEHKCVMSGGTKKTNCSTSCHNYPHRNRINSVPTSNHPSRQQRWNIQITCRPFMMPFITSDETFCLWSAYFSEYAPNLRQICSPIKFPLLHEYEHCSCFSIHLCTSDSPDMYNCIPLSIGVNVIIERVILY